MKVGTVDHGSIVIKPVKKGVPRIAGARTVIDLKDLPTRDGDMGLAVLAWVVVSPYFECPITSGCNWDGHSIAQAWGRAKLRVAASAPSVKSLGSRDQWDDIDVPALLDVLSNNAGVPCIKGNGDSVWIPDVPALDQTFETAMAATAHAARRLGWGQFIGPFGSADVDGATWKGRSTLFLPVGMRDGENTGDMAPPAGYYSGSAEGGCQGNAGELSFNLGAKIDNQPITWGGAGHNDTFDLYALMLRVPVSKLPAPPLFYIRRHSVDNRRINVGPGTITFLALRKELDANGNQLAHDYQQAYLELDGVPLTATDSVADQLLAMQFANREFFNWVDQEAAMGHLGTVRRARYGVPLVDHHGSLMLAAGHDSRQACVRIVDPGSEQGPFALVEAGYTIQTVEVQAAAEKASDSACSCTGSATGTAPATYQPNTRNGNLVTNVPALRAILPGRVVKVATKVPTPG